MATIDRYLPKKIADEPYAQPNVLRASIEPEVDASSVTETVLQLTLTKQFKKPMILKNQVQQKLKILDDVINDGLGNVESQFGTEFQSNWNILDRMLLSNITENKFNRDEIRGEIIGLFAAGHETTSNGRAHWNRSLLRTYCFRFLYAFWRWSPQVYWF